MFIWKNSVEQIKLMPDYKCPNDFDIILPNIAYKIMREIRGILSLKKSYRIFQVKSY